MKLEKRRVSDLIPNPINVRRHNQLQIQEFQKSINKFGVIRPIVIDENNVILAGHGLLEALKAKGIEEADVIVKKGLSEKDKKKLLLADNKVYDLGTNDYGLIDEILSEFGKEADFEIPGYDSETLEDLYGVRSIEKDAKAVTNIMPASNVASSGQQNTDQPFVPITNEQAVPSARVQEARNEAIAGRKVIICPHCGGIVDL